MKIYFENNVIKEAVDEVQIVNSDNAVVRFDFGVNRKEDKMLSCITVIGGTQQMSRTISHTVPKGAEDTKGVFLTVAFKAKEFFPIISSTITLNDRVYIDINGSSCSIGVDGVGKLSINVIDESKIPDSIPMDKSSVLFQAELKKDTFLSALRIGGNYVDPRPDAPNATGNAAVRIKVEPGEGKFLKGTMLIYSTDGKGLSRGKCVVSVINDPEIMKRGADYCKEKEIEDIMFAIPKKAIIDIFKAVSGYEKVYISFSKNHCFIATGQMIYTCTLGSQICSAMFNLDSWVSEERKATVVFDSDTLKERLDLLNKKNEISNEKPDPILICIRKDKPASLTLALSGEKNEMKIKTVNQKVDEDFSIALNGKLVSQLISSLKKGNIRFSFKSEALLKNPVEISNGDVDIKSEESIAYLFPVKYTAKAKKEEVCEDESDSEESAEIEGSDDSSDEATVSENEDIAS